VIVAYGGENLTVFLIYRHDSRVDEVKVISIDNGVINLFVTDFWQTDESALKGDIENHKRHDPDFFIVGLMVETLEMSFGKYLSFLDVKTHGAAHFDGDFS